MKCEGCGQEIRKREEQTVQINGDAMLPYCRKCAEEFNKKLDAYPKPDKPRT